MSSSADGISNSASQFNGWGHLISKRREEWRGDRKPVDLRRRLYFTAGRQGQPLPITSVQQQFRRLERSVQDKTDVNVNSKAPHNLYVGWLVGSNIYTG